MSNKHLTILLNRLARHTHTHTHKEMGPVGLYSALQPGRIGELEGQSLAGYLSASCSFFETSEPASTGPRNHQKEPWNQTLHQRSEDHRKRPQTKTADDDCRSEDQRAKSQKPRRRRRRRRQLTHTKSNGDPFLLRQFQPNSSEHSRSPAILIPPLDGVG